MNMIERVARAIQSHDPANIGHRTGYALARLAIEAMKEPTEEMKDCTHLYHSIGSEFAAEIYTTMIEAALKEG